MTLVFILYCVTTLLPGLSGIFLAGALFLGTVVFITYFILCLYWLGDEDIEGSRLEKFLYSKWLYIGFVTCVVLTNLIPDKEAAYILLAAYGVESVVTNDKVQEFGGKSLEVIEKAMNDYLTEKGSE